MLAGLLTYAFTDTTGILKLLVAIAYLFSIIVFLYRRIQNIVDIIRNRKLIATYSAIYIKGLLKYKYKQKIKLIVFDVYIKLYTENVSKNKSKIHKIGAHFNILPNQKEVFEIIYTRLLSFYWDVININFKKFFLFIITFTLFSIFIKNLVLLEMNFSTIFETIDYPFIYFIQLINKFL